MGTDDTARYRADWDEYAPRYDRDIRFFERVMFADGRQWVCGQAHGEVLEVAVGTGRNLPHYPAGVRLTGIDFSPGMLAVARTRAAELGTEVELREADAQALPYPEASFDTVVCTLGLCAVPDHRVAIGEMHRVLRPGGSLLLLDHVGSHWWPIWAGQRLLELFTARNGEYQTRRQLPVVAASGFEVRHSQRLKAGTVERLAAVRRP